MKPLPSRLRKPWDLGGRVLGGVNKFILGAGALAAAVVAILALSGHIFRPSKSCTGNTVANFKGPPEMTKTSSRSATVSYIVKTNGYTDKPLTVKWTLLKARGDGSFTPVTGFRDLFNATLRPTGCPQDQGGTAIPVAVEEAGRYRVVLDLFVPDQPFVHLDEKQTDITFS